MGKVGPIRRKAEELLAAGEWYNWELLLRDLMETIPPNRAYQLAENSRLHALQDKARKDGKEIPQEAPPRTRPTTDERIIAAGARLVVRDALFQRKGKHWYEENMQDGVKYVRLLPSPGREK